MFYGTDFFFFTLTVTGFIVRLSNIYILKFVIVMEICTAVCLEIFQKALQGFRCYLWQAITTEIITILEWTSS